MEPEVANSQEWSQETIIPSENMDIDVYNCTTENVFSLLADERWEGQERRQEGRQEGKRRRKDTGSVEMQSFMDKDINEKFDIMFKKLLSIEESQNEMTILHERVNKTSIHVDANTHRTHQLTYKCIDIDMRLRQNNMIIYGFDERNRDREIMSEVNDFLMKYLEIDPHDVHVLSVSRLGSPNQNMRRPLRRPLLVCFAHVSHVSMILRNARMLKGTKYSVDRDYPTEISSARKRLWPEVKRIRKAEPNVNVQLKFPAKIVKNGVVFRDEFPYWDYMINKLPSASEFRYVNIENKQTEQTPRNRLHIAQSQPNRENTYSEVVSKSRVNVNKQPRSVSDENGSCKSKLNNVNPRNTMVQATENTQNSNGSQSSPEININKVPAETKNSSIFKPYEVNGTSHDTSRDDTILVANQGSAPSDEPRDQPRAVNKRIGSTNRLQAPNTTSNPRRRSVDRSRSMSRGRSRNVNNRGAANRSRAQATTEKACVRSVERERSVSTNKNPNKNEHT